MAVPREPYIMRQTSEALWLNAEGVLVVFILGLIWLIALLNGPVEPLHW